MASSDSDHENNNTNVTWRTSQQRKLCYRDLLNKVEGIRKVYKSLLLLYFHF
jgi:hypothetical protein